MLQELKFWLFVFATILTSMNAGAQKIQAEDFNSFTGTIRNEISSDIDGTESVSHLNDGDVLYYTITLSQAKSYTISFRVASVIGGAIIFGTQEHGNLFNLVVPQTGGNFEWQNTDATVTLPAGTYTIAIKCKGEVNLNWMELLTNDTNSNDVSIGYNVFDSIVAGYVDFD